MITTMRAALLFAVMLIAACGGSSGGSSSSSSSPTYTVGGIVSGLSGTGLVLQNSGGNNLAVTTNGTVTFSTPLVAGSSYSISIKAQPTNPSQTCSLSGSTTGTITNANVVAVSVTCVTNAFTVRATVSGLTGSALVLQNNADDDIAVGSNGVVSFPVAIASGAQYAVTVKRQPIYRANSSSIQFCSVAGGIGVVGNGLVSNITVSCRTATGRFLYVPNTGDNTLSGFAIDAATGALTPIPGSPFHLDFPMNTSTAIAVQHLYLQNRSGQRIPDVRPLGVDQCPERNLRCQQQF